MKRSSEIVVLKIRNEVPLDHPEEDANNPGRMRTVIGWGPELAEFEGRSPHWAHEEVWHRSNGWRVLDPGRAVSCELALVVDPEERVRCVAKVMGVMKRDLDERVSVIGPVEDDKYLPWYGKKVRLNRSKNSVTYIDAKDVIPPDELDPEADSISVPKAA